MKNLTVKFRLLIGFIMLLNLSTQAENTGNLITEQITIKLEKAGTLPDRIADNKKYRITNLKIVGEINGTDVVLLRDMAGCDEKDAPSDGNLANLDLSEAKIVEGGKEYGYYQTSNTSENKIGYRFFYKCEALQNVILPLGITDIGNNAFQYCSGLTSIAIPSGVTFIGGSAFSGCSSLTSIDLPSGIKDIGSGTFTNCSSLTNIAIPSGVTFIGSFTFSMCSSLTSVNIPSGVTFIGSAAFMNCSSLSSIVIPSVVTHIEDHAFSGCRGLKSVYAGRNTPIAISLNTFNAIDKKSCTLYVPTGTSSDYMLSNWGDCFDNIKEYDVSGIEGVKAVDKNNATSRYDINGREITTPAKGVNIVKYSDGSTRKIVTE